MTLIPIKRLLSYSHYEYITTPINIEIKRINQNLNLFDVKLIKQFNQLIIEIIQKDYRLNEMINFSPNQLFYQKIFNDAEIKSLEEQITKNILIIKAMIREFKSKCV